MFSRGIVHSLSACLAVAVAVSATGCMKPKRKIISKTSAVSAGSPPVVSLALATPAQFVARTVDLSLSASGPVQYWCLSETQTTAPDDVNDACEGGAGELDGWSLNKPAQFTFANGDGPHRLYAWAVGTNSLASKGTASLDVIVDTAPPVFSMSTVPTYVRAPSFTINWSASDSSGIQGCKYRLNTGPMQVCPQPLALSGLLDGMYTVSGAVTDMAGNQTSFSASTTVDQTSPTLNVSGPASPYGFNAASFTFSASDTGSGIASTQCSLDGGSFANCTSPHPVNVTESAMQHSLTVLVLDQAGNSKSVTSGWTVDTTAPSVSVSTAPANPTPLTDAHFVFAASDAISGVLRMECQLDATVPANFTTCTGTKDFTGLALGTHHFYVRGVDRAGNVSIPTDYMWVIDSGAPEIRVAVPPPTPTQLTSVNIAWTSSDPSGITSETCQLDSGTQALCLSPVNLTGLGDGPHTLTIRATDSGGTVGALPVNWTVDTVAPVPTISTTVRPSDPSNDPRPQFGFAATDVTTSVAKIECQVDGTGYSICTAPFTTPTLSTGPHLFEIKATDAAGNESLPRSYTWFVDLIPPTLNLVAPFMPPVTRATTATISYTATDNRAIATRLCGLDVPNDAALTACGTSVNLTGVSNGAHVFTIKITDTAGNVSRAAVNWFVDPNYVSPELAQAAIGIGRQYNCPLASNLGYDAGEVGMDYLADQQAYAAAKLMVDKGCIDGGTPKTVTFAVSTLNFPSDGVAQGASAGLKGAWLQYWDDLAVRWSMLGFKVTIKPYPFIINDVAENVTHPSLRWLKSSELNLLATEIPEVFSCRDGRKTKLASIYDPKTLEMGKKFYTGVKTVFMKYAAFEKIALVVPSDTGEHAFPMNATTGWFKGSDDTSNCFKTGDTFAKAQIANDPPTAAKYNGSLNQFRLDLYNAIFAQFPGKGIFITAGRSDDDPTGPGGFEYSEITSFAAAHSIPIHSLSGYGADAAVLPLDKLTLSVAGVPALPPTTSLSLEDGGLAFEFEEMRNLAFAEHYKTKSHTFRADPLLNSPYLLGLSYGLGQQPGTSLYTDKGASWAQFGGLGTFRNSHLTQSAITAPAQGSTLNADANTTLDAWGYFETYGEMRNETVLIYAGPLSTDSPFNTGGSSPNSNASIERSIKGRDPQFMRLVGQTTTSSSRIVTGTDTTRFTYSWKPDLAAGSVVLRFFMANTNAEVIAELPNSPVIVSVAGKTTGKFSIGRSGFDGAHLCGNTFTMTGNARVSTMVGAQLDIVILDDYRGAVLAQGSTDASGNFSIPVTVTKQPGGAYPALRAYVYFDNNGDSVKELVGLPMDLSQATAGLGYIRTGNPFWTVADCP